MEAGNHGDDLEKQKGEKVEQTRTPEQIHPSATWRERSREADQRKCVQHACELVCPKLTSLKSIQIQPRGEKYETYTTHNNMKHIHTLDTDRQTNTYTH